MCLVLALLAAAHADTVTVPGSFPTIQAALDGAPAGSVIQLSPGTYHERIQIGAQHAVTLRGNPDDPASVVLDAGGAGDVIRMIGATSAMVVEGVTVTGGTGYDGYGGGLFMAQSQAIFRRCVFRGNHVAQHGGGVCILQSGGIFQECVFQSNTAGVYGGGVMVNDASTTAFDGCAFIDNQAGTVGAGAGTGGGVHVNDSSPTFVGCTFQANRGKSGAGVLALGHWDRPESIVTIENSAIIANVASRDPGGQSADGGGLHAEDNVQVLMRRTRVQDNVANVGGGLHTYRAVLEIRDTIIEDNTAVDDGVGGFGGGVAGQSVNVANPPQRPASILVSRTAVRNNVAVVAGGLFIQGDFLAGTPHGILTVDDSLVDGNQATTQGGGLKVDHADLTLRRSHVLRNRVIGAGLTFGGGLVSAAGSISTITQVTFAGNRSGTEGIGGGLYADQGGSIAVDGSRFVGNLGGLGGLLGGGAIAIGQSPGPVPGPITGTVRNSVIAGNGDNNEIFESSCDPAYWSTVEYIDNDLHSYGGAVYYRNCTGPTNSVGAFNAIGGKARGNQDREPTFVEFMATPGSVVTGTSSVLSWIVPAATSLQVEPSPGTVDAPFGTVDVTPAESTTYALTEGGDTIGTAAVDVVCAGLGSPIPLAPANRNARQTPGHVTLEWFATLGATSYDVYLDTGAEPSTLIASGVSGTTMEVVGLAPSTTYRWRVMANSPACGEPVAGPMFEFSTCANDECAFVDTFDDGDASDWTTFGKGTQRVAAGRLELKSRKRFGMLAPVLPLAMGAAEVRGQWQKGRKNLSMFFAWRDADNYGELVISAGRRWKVRGRVNGRAVRGTSARHKVPSGAPFLIRLEQNGSAVSVSRDGTPVLTSDLSGVGEGIIGVGGAFSTVAIDEVKIAATPGSLRR